MQLTDEQQRAVDESGRIIVSASAGSGKTTVMIERLVTLLDKKNADIRNVLCMTFTNKAAAQMRAKLRKELIKRISVETDEAHRTHFKEQLSYLPLADISTIHAFCARLVRSYFYLFGTEQSIDPAFRIIASDDAEGQGLKNRAMDEVLEGEYEEGSESFKALLSVYFRGKKDTQLRNILFSIYKSVRGLGGYRKVLEGAGEDNYDKITQKLFNSYRKKLGFVFNSIEDVGAYFSEHNLKAFAVCQDIQAAAEALLSEKNLFSLAERARVTPSISRMPPMTKASGEELTKLTFLKGLSAFIKDIYKDLNKFETEDVERARYLDGSNRAASLCRLVLKFDDAYARLKEEAGVLDYDDLEHFAIRVLEHSDALRDLKEKYRYLFVDEYQDVNPVQEAIISALSGDELFLVGDAKQSIYSFRGSRSQIFIDKTNSLPYSLTLSENFRSASAIIDAVNEVFVHCMTQDTVGLDYKTRGHMKGGAPFGEHTGSVQFHLLPAVEKQEKERGIYSVLTQSEEETSPQAQKVIQIIQSEVGGDLYDADKKTVRKAGYGDIAVLVRNTTSKEVGNIISALSKCNIPVTTTAKCNVCDFWEARLIIDWLSYLDNAEQDIPMAGAMLSSVGGFCERELALIRLNAPDCYTFREACMRYSERADNELSGKLKSFFERVEKYRMLARGKRASEMIGYLLANGLEGEIAAKRDGEVRLMRIRRLAAFAEDTSVTAFLHRLKACDYNVAFSESGGENAVKVLTMHSVKGLEYPIVILAGLDNRFHGADTSDVLFSEEFGFAPKSFDLEKRIAYQTLARYACAEEQIEEERKGEMNLFYVAMTRAQNKLHLLFEGRGGALSPAYAKKFFDFIDFEGCGRYFAQSIAEQEHEEPERGIFIERADSALKESILKFLKSDTTFKALPVKQSATGLMKEREIKQVYRANASGRASVDEGIAYHAFLEHVRFGKPVREELARMQNSGELSEGEVALLKEEQLEKILSLPSFALLAGKDVLREQRFLVGLPACEIPALCTDSRDEIILQGAIDLLLKEGDLYMIYDYKYSSHSDGQIREDYFNQLEIYKKAVAKIMHTAGKNVRARIINIMTLREIEM